MEAILSLRIKKLKQRVWLSGISVLICFISGLLGILSACEKSMVCILFFLVLTASIVVIVLNQKALSRTEKNPSSYAFQISAESFSEVCTKFSALASIELLEDNAADCFICYKYKIRCLILAQEIFDIDMYNKEKQRLNRQINRTHKISQWVYGDDERKIMRLNLIVVRHSSDGLASYLSNNACKTMRRVEGILNAALVLDEQKLMVPVMWGDTTVSDINKYEYCIKELLSLLGKGVP